MKLDLSENINSTTEYNIRELSRDDVIDPYFVKWIFNSYEFKNGDPEKFNFDILVHNPNIGNYCYGYFNNSELEGIIRIRDRKDYYAISMLFVNDKIHNQGIGQKLLKYAIDKFGNNEIRLNVFEYNKKAIYIYEKYGFKIIGSDTVTASEESEDQFVGQKYFIMSRKINSNVINESYFVEENTINDDNQAPNIDDDEKKEESRPKQVDKAESNKNGIRRKKLYIAFIEWCKEYNPKNTFGSIFDKDAFKVSYPFVPEEMRYFYRLANPMLCVLAGKLTFFPVADLRKLNKDNNKRWNIMIFAATENDLRIFNSDDKKVYRATEKDGNIELQECLGNTFDLYIQNMIKKGDILNEPLEESVNRYNPYDMIDTEYYE